MNKAILGDLGEFTNGVNFTKTQMGSGIGLINVKDITNSHRIDPATLDLVNVGYDLNDLAARNDIFFVRSSVKLSGIGLAAQVKESTVPAIHCGFVIRFRPTSNAVDSNYLLYLLKSHRYRELLKGLSGGAAIVNLSQAALKRLEIPLPTISVQQKIASVLSNYDDLIDDNRRRIGLLEEVARELHKEWFIRLRFPGHTKVKIVNALPEGWGRKTLGDLCTEVKKNVLPENVDPDTPYIGLEHIPRRSITLNAWGKASDVSSSKHGFVAGDILFGKIRPYFHKVGIAFVDGVASSDAIVIRGEEKFRNLVLMTVSSDRFVADTSQRMKEGSKMPRADWKQMQQYPVLVPAEPLLQLFNEIVGPITDQLRVLTFQNKYLQEARDILLPRLMNGEIEP
jgi:type I restriction enzyme S subunit